MQARLTTKPEQDVIAAIQALDLEAVKLRVMDTELGEGWNREHADSIELAYKNYLTMLVKYPDDAEDILLSEDVDEFWHTHILQTRKYTEDCQKMFGNFLHHEPHVGEVTATDLEKRVLQAERTRQLYEYEFGSTSEAAWAGLTVRANSAVNLYQSAAYSTAAIHSEKAAYSTATIRTGSAAYSTEAIRADKAAYSTAAIRGENAAYSTAAIRAEKAAYSTAAIRTGHAAYSTATIRAQDAAYSTAAIRAEKAAYSTAAISAENAAYSTATIRAEKAAYSTATLRA